MKIVKQKVDKALKRLEKETRGLKSKQRFAVFLSPGIFTSETDVFEITDKTINFAKLCKKAKSINQRYNAKPYGFRIEDGNGKPLSGINYITGELKVYDTIPDNQEFNILKSNMRSNRHPIVIENNNFYKFIFWFDKDDTILDWEGNVVRRGNDKDLVDYRNKKNEEFEEYYKQF